MNPNYEILAQLEVNNPEVFGAQGLFGGAGDDHIFLQRFLRYLEKTQRDQVSTNNFIDYLQKRSDLSQESIAAAREKLSKNGDPLPTFAGALDNLRATENPELANKIYDSALLAIVGAESDKRDKQKAAVGLAFLASESGQSEDDILPIFFGTPSYSADLAERRFSRPASGGQNLPAFNRLGEIPNTKKTIIRSSSTGLRSKQTSSQKKRVAQQHVSGQQQQTLSHKSKMQPKKPNKKTQNSLNRILKIASVASGLGLGGLLAAIKPATPAVTQTATTALDLLLK